jgi:hypothetical protein
MESYGLLMIVLTPAGIIILKAIHAFKFLFVHSKEPIQIRQKHFIL